MATLDVNVTASIDASAKSTGGNSTADAGKLLEFDANGGITAGTDQPDAVAVDASSDNGNAINARSETRTAALLESNATASGYPVLHVNSDNSLQRLAYFHGQSGIGVGMEVLNDGGLEWTSATGAGTTRTNLGLGGLATKNQVDTAEIADNAASNAKLANMAVNTIKGRITSGTGDPEDLTATQVRTILGIGVVERTGATIAFDAPAIYNSPTSPSSSTVTLDLSGAVAGTEVVAFFNHSAEPTWPAGVTAVGAWNNSALNAVRFLYQDSNDISAVIVSDATGVAPGTWTTIVKPAFTSRTSTTVLAADPDLKLALPANSKVNIRLRFQALINATPDFKYRISGPTSPTLIRGMARVVQSSGTAPAARIINTYDSADQTITATSLFTANVEVDIYIENGANAGDFELLWAQNTTDAASTRIEAGSYLEYRFVP